MIDLTYEEFIQNILNTRGRFACGDEYHERHHIIPKSCGGTNDEENLIDLYAKEHYEAHRLLALESPDNTKLVYAWWMMSHTNNANQRDYELTAEEYEEARKVFSESISGENGPMYGRRGELSPMYGKRGEQSPNYGKHLSEETKAKIKESLRKTWDNPEMREKARKAQENITQERRDKISKASKERLKNPENHPMYRKHHTEESRRKISESIRGEKHPNYGKHLSEETRKKISEANIGGNSPRSLPVVQCNLNGDLIKIYDGIRQASRESGIDSSSIVKCCKGKCKAVGGFKWYYLYDQIQKDGTIIPGAITLGIIEKDDMLKMLKVYYNVDTLK